MGNGYFFADMCELYDYCKENVIKEAKAKFGKETVAEDISSEISTKSPNIPNGFSSLTVQNKKIMWKKLRIRYLQSIKRSGNKATA